jgi:hypothetical protein
MNNNSQQKRKVAADPHSAPVGCIHSPFKSTLKLPEGEVMTIVETTISATRALASDAVAVRRLLDEVPDAEEIQSELCKPYFTRRWQQSMQRSFWITSDGTTAVCLTLTGLDVDEMVAVWVGFDDHRRRPGFVLSARTLSAIIESEIGVIAEIQN